MTKLQLFRLLRSNLKQSEKRSPLFEQNRISKIFVYLGFAVTCIYLIAIGTSLGWVTCGGDYDLIFGVMPLILTVDFLIRFGVQQTPAMMVKPYLLMPIKKANIIDCFLVSSSFSTNNLIWLSLFLPYFFITMCGGAGIVTSLAMLLVCLLLIVVNSMWYLLVRTLVNHNILWWLLPIVVYGSVFSPMIINLHDGVDTLTDTCQEYGFTIVSVLVYIVLLISLFAINRRVQMHFVYEEVSKQESVKLKHVSQFGYLNHFGLIGEYMKLEMKSIIRNKNIKKSFVQGLFLIVFLSGILAYTEVYDGVFSSNMWCLYCFVFFGAVNLVKVMMPEGNFIDLFMVHKENIYALLKAKYYFYCAILLLPTIILIPTVISGKFSILMILAYLFTTSGPEYFILFQLAVYNKKTMPLNEKITAKGNFDNSLQMITLAIVFFVPMALAVTLTTLFGNDTGYTILIAIGISFTVTNHLWLGNIYNRMMARHYDNLEGFHSTR